MGTLGATLARVEPGEVVIELAFRGELTQQHGFLHAGIVTSVLDSACGYAALSLMEVIVLLGSDAFCARRARGHHDGHGDEGAGSTGPRRLTSWCGPVGGRRQVARAADGAGG